jgi:hypothetical protein
VQGRGGRDHRRANHSQYTCAGGGGHVALPQDVHEPVEQDQRLALRTEDTHTARVPVTRPFPPSTSPSSSLPGITTERNALNLWALGQHGQRAPVRPPRATRWAGTRGEEKTYVGLGNDERHAANGDSQVSPLLCTLSSSVGTYTGRSDLWRAEEHLRRIRGRRLLSSTWVVFMSWSSRRFWPFWHSWSHESPDSDEHDVALTHQRQLGEGRTVERFRIEFVRLRSFERG